MPRSSSTVALNGLKWAGVNLGERWGERPQRGPRGAKPLGAHAIFVEHGQVLDAVAHYSAFGSPASPEAG